MVFTVHLFTESFQKALQMHIKKELEYHWICREHKTYNITILSIAFLLLYVFFFFNQSNYKVLFTPNIFHCLNGTHIQRELNIRKKRVCGGEQG